MLPSVRYGPCRSRCGCSPGSASWREPAGASSSSGRSVARRRVARARPRRRAGGPSLCSQSHVRRAWAGLVEGDEVALIPPVSGGAFRLTQGPGEPDGGRRRGRRRAGRRDRDLPRNRARTVARPRRDRARVRGVRGDGRGGHGRDRRATSRTATTSARSRSGTGSAGSRSARRASRSPSRRRTGRTRSRRAPTRSRRSRHRCRSGRRSSTWAARSGSAEVR